MSSLEPFCTGNKNTHRWRPSERSTSPSLLSVSHQDEELHLPSVLRFAALRTQGAVEIIHHSSNLAPETRERNCHPLRVANHRLYPLRPARCRISSALRSKLCWSLHPKIAPHVSHNKAKKGLYFGQQHIFPACPVPVQAMYCTAWPCSRITWSTKPLQAEIQAVSTPTRASQVFVIPKCDFTRQ